MQIIAPELKKGDVLFWNSGTIHGSLKTKNTFFTRKSFTCHFIPNSCSYIRNRYSNEVRNFESFKHKNFICKVDRNFKIKKKYKKRNISSFNQQNFN